MHRAALLPRAIHDDFNKYGVAGPMRPLLKPLYGSFKQVLFQSKVIGTDDTSVKLLDIKSLFARAGCICPTRASAGRARTNRGLHTTC
jgi:hypothetical protein